MLRRVISSGSRCRSLRVAPPCSRAGWASTIAYGRRTFGTSTTTSGGGGESRVSAAALTDTALLHMSGSDASKVLQDLITNDLNLLTANAARSQSQSQSQSLSPVLYTCFLNAKGRYLSDCMIAPFPALPGVAGGTESYLLLCDGGNRILTSLIAHINAFKLRRNLTLTPLSADQFTAAAVFEPFKNYSPAADAGSGGGGGSGGSGAASVTAAAINQLATASDGRAIAFIDPRTAALGTRIVVPTPQLSNCMLCSLVSTATRCARVTVCLIVCRIVL